MQFAAFGRTDSGDSVPVAVTFKASGGTITETGLYTAGQTPGQFRVIATAERMADTSAVTLAATSGGGTPEPEPEPVPEPSPAPTAQAPGKGRGRGRDELRGNEFR